MLEMMQEEIRLAHGMLEDMWLDFSYSHDYLTGLQAIYTHAETLVDHGDYKSAQYWLNHFWINAGEMA